MDVTERGGVETPTTEAHRGAAPSSPRQMPVPAPRRLRRKFLKHYTGLAGLFLLLLIVIGSVFAPLLAPYDPVTVDLGAQFQPPGSPGHVLGTDSFGRDILSRLLWGGRISLSLALAATVLSMGIGVPVGLFVGYHEGRIDTLVSRFVDILLAFPYLLLAIVIVGALGPGLTNAMLAVAVGGMPFYVRFVRGLVLSVKTQQHVEAARALGKTDIGVMLRHVLPLLYPYMIVFFALNAGYIILQASSLGFLGLGAQPPSPEWGAMLAENRQYVTLAPHTVVVPGAAILVVVLSLNLVGDALRDVLDVTLEAP